jgi:raffinose/stachyose/melibiose transport system permease protein
VSPLSQLPPAIRRRQAWLGFVLVVPATMLMVVFFIFPMISALYFAVIDFDGLDPTPPFVGLANFAELFTDPQMWHALGNNVIWIVIGTVSPIVIGLLIALLLWTVKTASVAYRLAFFLPYVLPGVAIGIVWSWIYDPVNGWLNKVLAGVGLDGLQRGWLGEPSTALYAVLATAIWATCGFVIMIFLAALRNVDVELVDAARIDGAGPVKRLWHIIVPQIMPVFLMVTTLILVGGFSVFDIVFIMTGGGPANATEVLGTYAYRNAFQLNRISYGTALALLITVLAVPFAVGLNRLQRRLSLEGAP